MKNEYKILAIDPGNNLGVSIYTLDAKDHSIKSIDNILLVLNNYIPDEGDGYEKMDKKLLALDKSIRAIVKDCKPKVLCLETSFLNMRFPKAVIQLSQYLSVIVGVTKELVPNVHVFRYSPKYVKSKIDAGGDAKKDDMTTAVMKIDEIKNNLKSTNLTEHEIDSLAIGYVGLKEVRDFPMVLCALST